MNKELETECIDPERRLEADAEVAVCHLVLGGIGGEKAKMAGNCEEQIVIPRGQ